MKHKRIFNIIRTVPLLFTVISILSTPVIAHNKVVVIPMAGDDIMPAPFVPLAPDDPEAANYQAGHFTSLLFGTPQTTRDKTTGLIWQRSGDNIQRNWQTALDYCADLEITYVTFLGNGILTDWRLPSVLELSSIVDLGATSNPRIVSAAFPNTNTSSYWSASSLAIGGAVAWRVGFGGGLVDAGFKTNSYYVRCVR